MYIETNLTHNKICSKLVYLFDWVVELTEKINEVDSGQEYIKITPAREQINSETVKRELYGLHEYGGGKKLPLDMELHIDSIEGVSNFEFIIYKPPGEPQFQFLMGPGERGEVTCDRLESTTRSQYPENFEFSRQHFDIKDVFDDVPYMIRYEGIEEKRKDWMTTLTTFDTETSDRSPISNLLETIIQYDEGVIFQVIFEPRSNWSMKAERQKGYLKQGVHGIGGLAVQSVMDAVLGVSDEQKQERHRGDTPNEVGGSIHDSQTGGMRSGTSRMKQIDLKDPAHTYNVTIRAAAENEECAKNLQDSLNQLSGQFYMIDGNYLDQNEAEYKRMLNHGITYPNGFESATRRKPLFVCNIDELSNFITVPSVNSLPKASRGGTGGIPAAQSPLTSPNEEVFQEFSRGMTIGHAVTALREREQDLKEISAIESKNEWFRELSKRDAISLSAGDLTHHYIRAATTGSGKTVATLNDMLTAYKDLRGPLIVVDPKGGGMCKNYLRCHRTIFGNLDDVEYMKIPEEDGKIPGMPFFDLRPLIHGAGRTRATAKQDLIDHYFQLLRFVLGRKTVEQAFVANEILTNLIKAMFDEKYGSDYFSIGELMEVAQEFQKYGKKVEDIDMDWDDAQRALPKVSDPQVRSILESHLEKDSRQFMNTTDAVLNRIRKLKERDFIWDMLSYKIEDEHWDDEAGWYDTEAVPMLDMKSILNSNKVLLLNTGELRGESTEVFTVLFLSHMWTAAQSIWTPDDDNYIANVIVEESANIARNEIVYKDLLPKGREFNISLGLIMQFPEQVLGDNPHENKRAYKEILNNVNTKIIGNIATDDLLAESLFHEDLDIHEIKDRIAGLRRGEWVVQLPSTGFNKQKPEILTLKPLPIPPGHSEGPFNVTSHAEEVRERTRNLHCVSRDHDAIDSSSGVSSKTGQDDEEEEPEDDHDDDGHEITFRHEGFMELVFDALTDGVNNYNLGQSMNDLAFSKTASDLVEWEYLEKEEFGNRQAYYKPTKKAQAYLDRNLSPKSGGEKGSESLAHRMGVRLCKTYYEQLGYDVEMYHSPEGEPEVYDVWVWATEDSPDDEDKVVEVETSPEKKGHVRGDYRKLSAVRAEAVWVVENLDGAHKLMNCLDGLIDRPPKDLNNFEKFNDYLNEHGAATLLGINNLLKEVKQG